MDDRVQWTDRNNDEPFLSYENYSFPNGTAANWAKIDVLLAPRPILRTTLDHELLFEKPHAPVYPSG